VRDLTRRVVTAIGVCGTLAMLAGCSPPSDVAFGYVNGKLTFVTCELIDATSITVEAKDDDNPWRVAWSAEGAGRFVREGFAVVQPPEGFEPTEFDVNAWVGAERVAVGLSRIDEDGVVQDAVGANVKIDDVPEDGWWRSSGPATDTPCE